MSEATDRQLKLDNRANLFGAPGLADVVLRWLPGLWLVTLVTAGAYGMRNVSVLGAMSPMIIGILLGVILCNLMSLPEEVEPGLQLAGKGLLRGAVALLGLQVTFGQLAALGPWSLASAVLVVASTFLVTLGLGKLLRVPMPLASLIGAGTAVCGASAIAGVNGALRAEDEDVTYAVVAITLFGTLAMFTYPILGQALDLAPASYGTWIGLSVHEVAQVVGAGFQGGPEAGQVAVVVKLSRVILLVLLISMIAVWMARQTRSVGVGQKAARPPLVPWFVVAFLILSGLHSLGLVPEGPRVLLVEITPLLLTAALSALGLGTHFGRLKRLGLRPMLLCALSTGFLAVLSFILATS